LFKKQAMKVGFESGNEFSDIKGFKQFLSASSAKKAVSA